MATSQNGYRANDRSLVSSRAVPGTRRKLTVRNGPAGDLLLWVAGQFDALVEDIDQGVLDDWGYAERTIRGDSTTLSNHASGTAIDLNATAHPLGTAPTTNYTAAEIARIRAVVARAEGCVRWGGDYTGRKDGMHFEINDGVTEARCAAVLAKLTAAGGASTTGDNDMQLSDKVKLFDGSETSVNNVFAGTLARLADPVLESREYKGATDSLGGFITAIDQNVIHLARAVEAQSKQIADLTAKLAALTSAPKQS